MFSDKSNKYVFHHLGEVATEIYPITATTELQYEWVKKIRELKRSDEDPLFKQTFAHICSGLTGIKRQGWVIRAWHDVMITTNGDGKSFQWNTPAKMESPLPDPPIGCFDSEQYADHVDFPHETSLKTLIKFHTGWRYHAPKGWGLMMINLDYTEENRFTVYAGVLEPKRSTEVNVLVRWHVKNGQELIKAGTPLAQLIPVKIKDTPDFLVRKSNDKEIEFGNLQNELISVSFDRREFAKVLARVHEKFFG